MTTGGGVELAHESITDTYMQFINGKEISAAVVAAAELRLADAIGDKPVDIAEIARVVGADTNALSRLMRALVTLGIFRRVGERSFAHTELSTGLRTGGPDHILDLVLLEGAEWGWRMSSGLAGAVRTGEPLFPALYGKDLFSYFMEDEPEAGEVFDRAMSAISEASVGPITDALDLGGARTVVDVGGGQGSLLRAVLRRHPDVTGTLLDIAPVIAGAHEELREGDLAARATLVPGDCREAVPIAADLYLFRHVLHMWEDDTCVQVLKNCVAAAPQGARIVVIEQLLTDAPEGKYVALLDLHMLAVGGGRARSAEDFERLFAAAGVQLRGVAPACGGDRLVEGTLVAG